MNAALLIFMCVLVSPISCAQCFANKAELRAAVDSFVADPTPMNPTSVTYGFPIGTWCVGAVTDMSSLFQDKNNFDGDLSTWNVSSVTDMNNMFRDASSFNGDLSAWDVSSVTNMRFMFYGASSFDRNISNWDVSRVTDMGSMFQLSLIHI